MSRSKEIIALEQIESTIYEIRGERVMLDSDLAKLYGVETKYLIRSFKRNIERFPQDFVFQLSDREVTDLKCQIGTSSSWGGRRTPPFAFNEHGAIMLATVLNSTIAIQMSVYVVRAFVRARRFVEQHQELAEELKALKRTLSAKFNEYDEQLRVVLEAINQLIAPLEDKKRHRIGF